MKTYLLLIATVIFSFFTLEGNAQQVSSTNTSAPSVCDGSAQLLDSANVNPSSIYWASSGTVIQQGSYYIYNLCAGTYTVTYTDGSGLNQTYTFIIGSGSGDPCAGFYAYLTTTSSTDTVNCNGTVSVTAIGGTPSYFYTWNTPSTGSTPLLTGMCSGLYTCVVTDANGCNYTVQGTITDSLGNSGNPCSGFYATVNVYPSTDSVACNGLLDISVYGGTSPYSYTLASGISSSSNSIGNLCPGTYVVAVSDANGCSYTVAGTIMDSSFFVADSTNIISNPSFGDSTITDTLDYSWIYDCIYDLGSIDSAYVIDNSSFGIDSVMVTWILIDSNGVVLGTYSVLYPTGGSTGVVTVFLTVLCPHHSQGSNYLIASDQIYLSSAGLEESSATHVTVINPFEKELKLVFEQSVPRTIWLYDMKGGLVAQATFDAGVCELNTATLQKGMYILHIQEGMNFFQTKVMKH